MKKSNMALGLAAGSVIAAGATLFFAKTKVGKDAVKKIKNNAIDLSKKATAKLDALKEVTQEKYNVIIDDVVEDFVKSKKIAKHEVKSIKQDLKSHWQEIKKELKAKSVAAKPVKSKKNLKAKKITKK